MSTSSSRVSLIALASAAAGAYTSEDQINEVGHGVQLVVDVTVATTTSVVFKIQGKDPLSGKYYDLLTSAAVTTVSTNVYTLYPGVTVSSGVAVSAPLPRVWRVSAAVTGGASVLSATISANICV